MTFRTHVIAHAAAALSATGAAGVASSAERYDPVADPAAVVAFGKARFTVLTPRLIRLEWSPEGIFEDRASFAFVNRRLPAPKFEKAVDGEWLTIRTDALAVRYRRSDEPFAADNLQIESKLFEAAWMPGRVDRGNLKSTIRTLDGVSGSAELPDGILSREGWQLVDDSERLLFDEQGWAAVRSRADQDPVRQRGGNDPSEPDKKRAPVPSPEIQAPALQDWYFFAYGHDYRQALRDFTAVAGEIPLPPRYVFGAWWSRYWAYSDAELRELVGDFEKHDVPLDVLVIDMDWHLDGWTGYTWNPKYFPDPDGFLKWCQERGLRATLNLHPAEGVGKHEHQFPEFCRAMGLDPAKAERVPFDCADPRYMDAYFKLLHHPEEARGVDFWWIDWQQGRESRIPGLDPLFWLNHLHWRDMAERAQQTGRRPMIFSRWGGLGNHRYQIGFSGDTFCDWRSLAFQPYFTSTAGNVGYAFWSHDIGGHQPGRVDPELYARWIQWGALSPVLRTHTTKNPEAERRIWQFPPDVFEASRAAFRLRYELLPYIYTMARKAHDEALPLCRPLYYHWPEEDEAYKRPGQYMFGDDLLVAPVTKPVDSLSGCANIEVWLPPGDWTNWFTGRTYTGPRTAWLLVPLDEIPLFVRGGAVIPAQRPMRRSDEKPVDELVLHVWPGERGQAEVYEDDGMSEAYATGEYARTHIANSRRGNERVVFIGRTEGQFSNMVQQRAYEVRFHDIAPPREVLVNGDVLPRGAPPGTGWHYDARQMAVIVRIPAGDVRRSIEIVLRNASPTDLDGWLSLGLRGQWNVLERVAADAEAQLAVDRTSQVDDYTLLRDARRVVESWPRLAINASSDSRPDSRRLRQRFWLLGIAFDLQISMPAEGRAGPTAEITLVATHGLPGSQPLAGRIALSTSELSSGVELIEFDRLQPGIPLAKSVALPALAGGRTVALHGTLQVNVGETELSAPFERVLLPSINCWWVAGPFEATLETGLATVFPPEAGFDLKADYEGKEGAPIGWKRAVRNVRPGDDLTDEFFVHLHNFYGRRIDNAVAYGFTYLHSPRDMDASLAIGSDDGVAVWLNGVEVHRKNIGRPYSPKQDRVSVRLNAGVNQLLLKVSQGGGDWGFSTFVESPDGHPLPEVVASLEPATP